MKLNKYDNKLEEFVNLNPGPVLKIDYNGNIIFCNNSVKYYFNINNKNNWFDFNNKFTKKFFNKIINSENFIQQEITFNNKHILLTYINRPKTKHIYIYGTDITQRKNIEYKFKQMFQAVEQSPISVIITDIKGKIEYINPKFEKLTGYSKKEILGKTPGILNSGLLPHSIYQKLWKTIKQGKEWKGELHNKKKTENFIGNPLLLRL